MEMCPGILGTWARPIGCQFGGMIEDLCAWRALFDPERESLRGAVLALRDPAAPSPSEVASLRKSWSAAEIAVAFEWVVARARAETKFSWWERIIADRDAVEQASDERVAHYKASRIAAAASRAPILDLCSGLGGDTLELKKVLGVERVSAVDSSPTRAWMTERNTGVRVSTDDAAALLSDPKLTASFVHIDPGRRENRVHGVAGRRQRESDQFAPPLSTCLALWSKAAGGVLKLPPSQDFSELPADAEIEVLAHPGGLLQALAWGGQLRTGHGQRRATLWTSSRRHGDVAPPLAFAGIPDELPTVDSCSGAWLVLPHPALERLELVGSLLASLNHPVEVIAPGLGWYLSEEPPPSPWLRAYRVLARCSFHERRVREAIMGLEGGEVTIKTRGGAIDPAQWTPRLQGTGTRPLVLFVLRLGKSLAAIITDQPRP